MQVPPGHQDAGMAFHRVHGTEWSPIPGLPHDDPTRRVLHRPSTAATLHLAAVAEQGARLYPAHAARLLTAARTAHAAAHANPLLIAPDDQGRFGGGPYGDEDVDDDFYWAAAELWLATGESTFLDEVTASPQHRADAFPTDAFDFDRVGAPPAHPRVRSRPATPRRARGRGQLPSPSRAPLRPAAGRVAAAAVLPGRPTSETTNDICIRWNAPMAYIADHLP